MEGEGDNNTERSTSLAWLKAHYKPFADYLDFLKSLCISDEILHPRLYDKIKQELRFLNGNTELLPQFLVASELELNIRKYLIIKEHTNLKIGNTNRQLDILKLIDYARDIVPEPNEKKKSVTERQEEVPKKPDDSEKDGY